jgi:hypothetical protein
VTVEASGTLDPLRIGADGVEIPPALAPEAKDVVVPPADAVTFHAEEVELPAVQVWIGGATFGRTLTLSPQASQEYGRCFQKIGSVLCGDAKAEMTICFSTGEATLSSGHVVDLVNHDSVEVRESFERMQMTLRVESNRLQEGAHVPVLRRGLAGDLAGVDPFQRGSWGLEGLPQGLTGGFDRLFPKLSDTRTWGDKVRRKPNESLFADKTQQSAALQRVARAEIFHAKLLAEMTALHEQKQKAAHTEEEKKDVKALEAAVLHLRAMDLLVLDFAAAFYQASKEGGIAETARREFLRVAPLGGEPFALGLGGVVAEAHEGPQGYLRFYEQHHSLFDRRPTLHAYIVRRSQEDVKAHESLTAFLRAAGASEALCQEVAEGALQRAAQQETNFDGAKKSEDFRKLVAAVQRRLQQDLPPL